MIYTFDVKYSENQAKAVCLGIENWADKTRVFEKIIFIEGIEEYVPGSFYKRELPCIVKLLQNIELKPEDIFLVDGYVFLNDDDKPGLGYYLWKEYKEMFAVVGVAKSRFHNNTKNVVEVFRGESKNPLFITAIGADVALVAEKVKGMAGNFRIPDILQLLDRKTKE